MIPYGRQFIDSKDIEAVDNVLLSDWLTQGPDIAEFERRLARYCGARYAVAVSSGTAALHVAYLAAGLKKGDEVITTPNTFVATTNMLIVVGAKPVFADIRKDTNNIDETLIEGLITKRTRAIVPVHFAGHPCEMTKIRAVAKKHKLIVIEDACHALGAMYRTRKIGSLSDMAVFSFHPVKSITTGEGGAIVTNDEVYYKKMLSLRSHGIHKDEKGKNVMTEMGYNYRLTDIQAALGISQLKKLTGFVTQRRKLVRLYRAVLKNCEDIIIPVETVSSRSSWHLYIIRVKNSLLRDDFVAYLKKNGIGVNMHYPCVYGHPYYKSRGYAKVDCPVADLYEKSTVTIPLYPTLKKSEVEYIARTIRNYFKARK